jgi:hypothetical protein
MAITNCKVTFGINNVCGDLLQASGVDKDFYVGYVSDLSVRFNLNQAAAISSISFAPYNGLVKFSGQKFAHEFSYDLDKAGGGAISYSHKAIVRLMNLSTQDDLEIQKLTQAQDAFFVFQDNNESFFILGPGKGMVSVAGTLKTTGQAAGADTITTVSFLGNEKVIPLRFTAGTTDVTVALLESYIR